ncbi:MAG: [formate-C-acetyltransferase]-activating enzyme [Bacillota bacterium]
MKKAVIYNIQRYSIHDGGGIRTIIFFKGCPLRCPWCSNPESQDFSPELMRREALCIQCSSASCHTCTMNAELCPTGALEIVGKEFTVEEVIAEIKKDILFYDSTNGGVTLSGGEPLCQSEFALDLLKRLKHLGIDTAIETTGFRPWEVLDGLSDYLDRILFDLKIMDISKAADILHADMDIIKDNFMKLVQKGVSVIPRIPLIPTFTMHEKNICDIIDFMKPLEIKEVHLLPFHQYGSAKYKGLNKPYPLKGLFPPSTEEITAIQSTFEKEGFNVIIGGQ